MTMRAMRREYNSVQGTSPPPGYLFIYSYVYLQPPSRVAGGTMTMTMEMEMAMAMMTAARGPTHHTNSHQW